MDRKAFTFLEIIIAMLVAGIVAALAVPKVVDLVNEARRGDELNTVGNVKSGIALTYLGNVTRGITPQYPSNLDNATLAKASPTNPIYDLVLQRGITKSWEKLEQYRYRGPTGQEYEYDPNDGTFEAVEALLPPLPPPPIIPPFSAIFGGAGLDSANSILATSDGGYIMAGLTWSFDRFGTPTPWYEDIYLIKTDAFGNILWEMTSAKAGPDSAYEIQQTSDGGYIITGDSGTADAYLLKIDSSGNTQWEKALGGAGYEVGYSVQQTSDGGYIMTGSTDPLRNGLVDVYLVKVDSSGNTQWEKTFGGSELDNGFSVQETPDEGYIIAGSTNGVTGSGLKDGYLIKTNSLGELQWERTFGGAATSGWIETVETTSDGGYVITGPFVDNVTNPTLYDFYLTKLDASGATQWQQTYGGTDWDMPSSVQQTSDGGYVITGYSKSNSTGIPDVYLVKTDSSGNTQWEKTYGGSGVDKGTSVQEITDPNGEITGYAISAYTDSFGDGSGEAWLLTVDADGNNPNVTGP